MAITITRSEQALNSLVPAGTTLANHTFSVNIGDIIIDNTENNTLNNYTTTPTTGTIMYDNSSGGRGLIADTFSLRFYINDNYIRRATYRTQANTDRGYALSAGVLGTIARDSYWWDTEYTVSDYFNENNKTAITVPVAYRLDYCYLQTIPASISRYGDVGYANYNDATVNIGYINLRLNVPPEFQTTNVSLDTTVAYTGVTTASVTVSDCTAYYGGDITSVKLTIGSQTKTINGNGTLSILLNAAGRHTASITVTDSRGQTTTRDVGTVIVNQYAPPTVLLTQGADRTLANGIKTDEGTYAVVNTHIQNFIYDIDDNHLLAPIVTVTDEDGVITTPNVTWYSERDWIAGEGELDPADIMTWDNVRPYYGQISVYALLSDFDVLHSYDISITPRDVYGSGQTKSVTLEPAFFTVDFLAGGHGIAFGTPAVYEGFVCNMNSYFPPLAGAIMMYAGVTPPDGWLICDGSAISRAAYSKLFSVIGTRYGAGDGSTTFNLPNLQGRVAIGATYPSYTIGSTGGSETVTLNYSDSGILNSSSEASGYGLTAASAFQNRVMVARGGGATAHNNIQPYLALNYIIHTGRDLYLDLQPAPPEIVHS